EECCHNIRLTQVRDNHISQTMIVVLSKACGSHPTYCGFYAGMILMKNVLIYVGADLSLRRFGSPSDERRKVNTFFCATAGGSDRAFQLIAVVTTLAY